MAWLYQPLQSGGAQLQAAGGGASNTLAADAGSVTLSGQTANSAVRMAAAAGSIAITGFSVPNPSSGGAGGDSGVIKTLSTDVVSSVARTVTGEEV